LNFPSSPLRTTSGLFSSTTGEPILQGKAVEIFRFEKTIEEHEAMGQRYAAVNLVVKVEDS
jgi:hypothetical protein